MGLVRCQESIPSRVTWLSMAEPFGAALRLLCSPGRLPLLYHVNSRPSLTPARAEAAQPDVREQGEDHRQPGHDAHVA